MDPVGLLFLFIAIVWPLYWVTRMAERNEVREKEQQTKNDQNTKNEKEKK